MIHIIKNYKWVIATSIICIIFGLLTFFTFTNQSFITLKDFNLQILLIVDLILLLLFFGLIVNETYNTKTRKPKWGNVAHISVFHTYIILLYIYKR